MTRAHLSYLLPSGELARAAVSLDAPRIPLPLPPAPPVVEPPPVDPERWSFVPDGTLVTDAFTAMFGAAPSTSPDGKRICLHKNINEQEWREIEAGTFCHHLFDRSRYPGDVGWYLYAPDQEPLWAYDRFLSGQALLFDGEIVEMKDGRRNRWTHRNTLFGLKQGGTCVQFDPRFQNQDYGPDKCYERQFNRLDGGIRWELWYSPEAARSLPWGDRSLDVLKQAVEAQAQPGQPTPAYIECPRLSVSDDPWATPKPPQEPSMTDDEIRRFTAALDDPLVFGALQRFHNEVLPRDRPADPVTTADGGVFNTADVVTGGAFAYFVRKYVSEAIIAQGHGRTAAQASGDGYDKAIAAYNAVVNPPVTPPPTAFRGPISAEGRDFVAPV
jgi:hypothetical protein